MSGKNFGIEGVSITESGVLLKIHEDSPMVQYCWAFSLVMIDNNRVNLILNTDIENGMRCHSPHNGFVRLSKSPSTLPDFGSLPRFGMTHPDQVIFSNTGDSVHIIMPERCRPTMNRGPRRTKEQIEDSYTVMDLADAVKKVNIIAEVLRNDYTLKFEVRDDEVLEVNMSLGSNK